MGKTQSKRYINKKDFQYEFDSRTHGYGYQVTDESMIPQLFNSPWVVLAECHLSNLIFTLK